MSAAYRHRGNFDGSCESLVNEATSKEQMRLKPLWNSLGKKEVGGARGRYEGTASEL